MIGVLAQVEVAEDVRERAAEISELVSPADVLVVLLILVVTYYIIRLFTFLAQGLSSRLPQHRLLLLQLIPLTRIFLWLFALYVIVVGVFDPSRESLVAFAATAGIGIGFAAQDVLKNVFGGIIIVIDRPFQVGDLIDIGDFHGEVVSIGLRATRLKTLDDSIVSVPNSEVVNQSVSNANTGALDCMVVVELFLPGLSDPMLVKRIGYEAAAASPYLYSRKPIAIRMNDEFRETFLTRVKIKAYVYDHRLETAFASDVTERAKEAFREAGLLPRRVTLGLDVEEQEKYLTGPDSSAAGARRS